MMSYGKSLEMNYFWSIMQVFFFSVCLTAGTVLVAFHENVNLGLLISGIILTVVSFPLVCYYVRCIIVISRKMRENQYENPSEKTVLRV